MKEYRRTYPLFALCGLNCGLCPRHHTGGASQCPGCGGPYFHLKHPSCAVITCNAKHGNVEFCFQCSSYPCGRYAKPSSVDSFISYRHVLADFEKARKKGVDAYMRELDEKNKILEFLIKNCNEGKRKSFYCLAVNLLSLPDLRLILRQIEDTIDGLDISLKEKAGLAAALFEATAKRRKIPLLLRKS